MNRWDRFSRFESGPKKPPPKHGIKMKKSGTTWWGLCWLEALVVVLRGDSGRLSRGRTYARAGRTHDLEVKAGKVTAKVTGSRASPYEVSIELAQLSDAGWSAAIALMAGKAHFAAELLAGRMPERIDEAFHAVDLSLFPRERAELSTACSCPDWGDPCKHVAATHYVLGEALDRDPFLLFELRGRTQQQVLALLRAAREGSAASARAFGEGTAAAVAPAAEDEPPIPNVTLTGLNALDYDKPRAALPSLHLSFHEPESHGAVLRQLGAPVAWTGELSPADLLGPLLEAAAAKARRIALAEPDAEASDEPASEAPRQKRPRLRPAKRAPMAADTLPPAQRPPRAPVARALAKKKQKKLAAAAPKKAGKSRGPARAKQRR